MRSTFTAFYETHKNFIPRSVTIFLFARRSILCQSVREIILFSFLRQHTANFIVFLSFTTNVNKLALWGEIQGER